MEKDNNIMEEWARWEPAEEIKGRFFIENFEMSCRGVKIKLRAEKESKKIEIIFLNGVDAYRCINESWIFDQFALLKKQYGADFYAQWSFFKIKNSHFAKSLSSTSCGQSDDVKFDHFCIVGNDEAIDILATYYPVINVVS